jgi:hypothetical protein
MYNVWFAPHLGHWHGLDPPRKADIVGARAVSELSNLLAEFFEFAAGEGECGFTLCY